ncbi:MAG: hypothetical protein CSA54_03885 [Gammaproteobacteria bacterium]|nr:MAG: hypothetical protein CSA54_03885 [Gammaproteobacteria bacterium]
MAQHDIETPIWSAESLRQFLQTATAAEIQQLDIASLPDGLPEDLCEMAPAANRQAVEDLLFASNAYYLEQRQQMVDLYGEEVSMALDKALVGTPCNSHLLFKKRLKVLVDLYQENRSRPSREQEALYQPHIDALEETLNDVKEEMGELARGAYMLREQLDNAPGALAQRFKEASKTLDARYAPMQQSLNLYYYVRMIMTGNEMMRVRKESASLDGKARILQVQINVCRDELKRFQSKMHLSRQEKTRKEHLQKQIADYVEDLQDYEVLISETDLVGWLDIIVEASMSEYAKKRARQAIRTGRLELFSLLQKYCELQEAAAKQIARNPFSQTDPQQAIKFLLQSEQFILGYFARKKSAITAWLGGAAAGMIKELGNIEKSLLAEMKQNQRKLK